MERTQTLGHDPLAKFTNEEILEGLTRLFKCSTIKTCACGKVSRHATCDDCRAESLEQIRKRRVARNRAAQDARPTQRSARA
jgi:hypothetical protein